MWLALLAGPAAEIFPAQERSPAVFEQEGRVAMGVITVEGKRFLGIRGNYRGEGKRREPSESHRNSYYRSGRSMLSTWFQKSANATPRLPDDQEEPRPAVSRAASLMAQPISDLTRPSRIRSTARFARQI